MAKTVGAARRVSGPSRGPSGGRFARAGHGGFVYAWEFPRRAKALPVVNPNTVELIPGTWGNPATYNEAGGYWEKPVDANGYFDLGMNKTFDQSKYYVARFDWDTSGVVGPATSPVFNSLLPNHDGNASSWNYVGEDVEMVSIPGRRFTDVLIGPDISSPAWTTEPDETHLTIDLRDGIKVYGLTITERVTD